MGQLKGIRRVRQDGKIYRYHRASGIRLPDEIDEHSIEFIDAWRAAELQKETPRKRSSKAMDGTLAHLWQSYAKSPSFLSLSPGYRDIIRRRADDICRAGGSVPIAQIRSRHIRKDLQGLEISPSRWRLKAWRALFCYAMDQRLIEDNPAKMVEQIKTRKPLKHKKWEADHIVKFRKRWPIGTRQRLAFEAMLYLGCRLSDLVRLGPGMVDVDGWLKFRQQKTGGAVAIPFHRAIPPFADSIARAFLLETIEAVGTGHLTWLTTEHGSSRSAKSVSNWFSAACREAGLTSKTRRTAHGLRVTCATNLAECGATAHQIGAWTGHESLSEIEAYTREAERMRLVDGTPQEQNIVQVKKT